MPRLLRLFSVALSVAAGLAVSAAPAPVSAQEQLHLSLFGDEALHRLMLVHLQRIVGHAAHYARVFGRAQLGRRGLVPAGNVAARRRRSERILALRASGPNPRADSMCAGGRVG